MMWGQTALSQYCLQAYLCVHSLQGAIGGLKNYMSFMCITKSYSFVYYSKHQRIIKGSDMILYADVKKY